MTTAQNRSPLRSTATMSVGVEPAGTEPMVFAEDTELFDIENPASSTTSDRRMCSPGQSNMHGSSARRHTGDAVGTAP